jgi:hypothetical protein
MKSILSFLLLSAAIAGPAAAEDIRISLADKDSATVRAEIDRAADAVCSSAYRDGQIEFQEMLQCPSLISADAQDQAKAIESVKATASVGALASNSLAPAAASK